MKMKMFLKIWVNRKKKVLKIVKSKKVTMKTVVKIKKVMMKIVIMIHGQKSLKKRIKNNISKKIFKIHKHTKRTNFKTKKDKILTSPIQGTTKIFTMIKKTITTIDLNISIMKTIDHINKIKTLTKTQPKRTKRILIHKINIPKILITNLKANLKIANII